MAKDVEESALKKRKKRESPEKSNGADASISVEDLRNKYGLEKELNPVPIYQVHVLVVRFFFLRYDANSNIKMLRVKHFK